MKLTLAQLQLLTLLAEDSDEKVVTVTQTKGQPMIRASIIGAAKFIWPNGMVNKA